MITVIATTKIGKCAEGDKLRLPKYAARALVAMNKAKFEDIKDEFRVGLRECDKKPVTTRRRGGGKSLTAEPPAVPQGATYERKDLQAEVIK